MTNKDKLDAIRNYIDSACYDAINKVNRDDIPSAKWIYTKGQSDMAARIREVINEIMEANA